MIPTYLPIGTFWSGRVEGPTVLYLYYYYTTALSICIPGGDCQWRADRISLEEKNLELNLHVCTWHTTLPYSPQQV